jgi:hypothetical protein
MAVVSEARAQQLRELVGDPSQVAHDLARFREAARALSSDQPRFIEEYPQKWVAVLANKEVLASDSLDALLKELDEKGVSREHAIVRFIDRNERTLFL